ncbi:LysR substrate-binding domain-containing protein [Rhodoligotrophos defluvii]|uniref:LysR substrate-binding domain-containing protein n=1 Tax=Rhodoligotrophos defluvii TaxID=2561934 RepID=UPI0010C9ABE9|nr:LysR substrate-binding domain-containing protein [Rhodoligotrophos defluvii]
MRFSLRQLQYLVAAAEAGSITRASERISVSQPSISAAISQLETELGITLFVRQFSQGMSLTRPGERVYLEARAILDACERLYEVANQHGSELHGSISVGCLLTLAPMIMPGLCHEFSVRNPGVEISTFEGSQDQLISMTRRGEIDILITYDIHIPEDLEFTQLVALPPYILMAPGHRFATRAEISLHDVGSEPYIMLDLPYSRDYFLSLFTAANVTPNITRRSSQPEVVRTMVANGYGISVFAARPYNERALDGKPVVAIPLSDEVPRLPLGYALKRQIRPTRIVSAFAQHIRGQIREGHIPGMRAA